MKPKNTGGGVCPLRNRPTEKVCHDCELWRPMYVEEGGQEKLRWECSFVWSIMLAGIAIGRLDGIQKSQETMRNGVWEMKEGFGLLVNHAVRGREHARSLEQQGDAGRPARLEADKG